MTASTTGHSETSSVSDRDPAYVGEFIAELERARVDFVTAVPESLLKGLFRRLPELPGLKYIPATNEAELPGIAAGAYLGGRRAVIMMENSGVRQACEPIARFAYSHQVPMVMVMALRGDLGESHWWGHNHAQTMRPVLDALRIPYWVLSRVEDIRGALERAFVHADSSQWPVVLVLSGECVEKLPNA